MSDVSGISGYNSIINSISGETTKSNSTLTTEQFFQLIAAELQNQDMSNPMDNSEMMNQMTQIAMMQSMNNFATAMDDFAQLNTINYGTSMMGKEVMVAYVDKAGNLQKKTGTVTRVDIFDGTPTLYLDDDQENSYSVANIMSVYEKGHKPPEDLGDKDDGTKPGDKVEEEGSTKPGDGTNGEDSSKPNNGEDGSKPNDGTD